MRVIDEVYRNTTSGNSNSIGLPYEVMFPVWRLHRDSVPLFVSLKNLNALTFERANPECFAVFRIDKPQVPSNTLPGVGRENPAPGVGHR